MEARQVWRKILAKIERILAIICSILAKISCDKTLEAAR
jgi:hypothetical protein